MKKNIFFLFILFLNGCSFFQKENKVVILEGYTYDGCHDSCIYADYLDLSERVTNKMLSSEIMKPLLQQKVKIRVELMKNNTKVDELNSNAMYERIIETLLNSKKLRIMSHLSDSHDYRLSVKFSETLKKINDKLMTEQKLELQLFILSDKVIGDWSETIIAF